MTITFEQARDRILNDPLFRRHAEPWGDEKFAALKAETGCTAPPQLERILREIGPFYMGYPAFLAVFETGEVVKTEIHSALVDLEYMTSSFRSLRLSQEFPNRFPLDMIFFGAAEAGHAKLLMHSAEKEDGAVYLWPITGIPWGEPGNHRGLGKVTDSLYEFFYYVTDWDNV